MSQSAQAVSTAIKHASMTAVHQGTWVQLSCNAAQNIVSLFPQQLSDQKELSCTLANNVRRHAMLRDNICQTDPI